MSAGGFYVRESTLNIAIIAICLHVSFSPSIKSQALICDRMVNKKTNKELVQVGKKTATCVLVSSRIIIIV